MAHPIMHLMGNVLFEWGPKEQAAFDVLKCLILFFFPLKDNLLTYIVCLLRNKLYTQTKGKGQNTVKDMRDEPPR